MQCADGRGLARKSDQPGVGNSGYMDTVADAIGHSIAPM